MLSRNRSLLSAMAVMACLELLVAWDAEAQGYFYAIGHMTNTRSAVDWTVSTGANALEVDLSFDDAGNPTVFRHGFPCDCTCFTRGVCDHLDSCDASTDAPALLQHIATKPIALLVIDSKVDGSTNSAAGRNVVNLLASNLFAQGFGGAVIIGAPKLNAFPYLQAAAEAAQASPNGSRMYFTLDGEGNDVSGVLGKLVSLASKNIVYGTGISACLPGEYETSILIGAANKGAGVIGLDYIWTLDKETSMARYIESGAQGIMTNYPDRLVDLLRRRQIPLAAPGTAIPPSTNPNVITQAPSCVCASRPGGCVISSAAPAGLACDCELSSDCAGVVVACKDPISSFCLVPGTSIESCLQGGGNCNGYKQGEISRPVSAHP
jgi:hypothetical protein